MTRRRRQPAGKEEIEWFREICNKAGIRLTHQRLELFNEMAAAKDHPSAEDIYRRLRQRMPTISLDTVYRTLATFEQYGLIKRLQVLGERTRFDSDTSPHQHMVCLRCQRVDDFSWPCFEQMGVPSETSKWGLINSRHVELRGLCRKCLQSEGARFK